MIKSKALTSALQNFTIKDNTLEINGQKLSSIITEYGTPLYLYDKSIIQNKIELLRKNLPEDIEIYYAVKSNPNLEVLNFIKDKVDGFDIASIGEMDRLVKAGYLKKSISFAGPGKNSCELSRAVKDKIDVISVESESELIKIDKIARNENIRPGISLRINPDFDFKGSGMKMGGGSKQFGIDLESVPELLKRVKNFFVDFMGFHIFSESQNLDSQSLINSFNRKVEIFKELGEKFREKIKFLNFGGGLGIPYFMNDETFNIEEFGHHLTSKIKTLKDFFPNSKFILELGRYISGESGLYITEVLYKKKSRDKTYLILDGGMNHHLAASGNLGQILRKNYPIINPLNIYSEEVEKVDITGPLCTPLDSIAVNAEIPITNEGDYIAVMNSGAYGYSASPLFFLSHDKPREIVL